MYLNLQKIINFSVILIKMDLVMTVIREGVHRKEQQAG